MATSAKNETTCGYNGHYHLYMAIKVNSQNANTNQSNVTVTMYAQSDSSSYGAYNLDVSGNSVKMTVNGSQVISKTMAMDFRNRATVNLGSWTGNISHGADGKKTLACSGSFSISGSSYLSNGSISCSIVLDQIPRATKPTLSASTIALGNAVTIKIAPAVSSWTHNLYYRVGTGSWTRFATGVKANYAWTLPLAIADNFPSATSGTITIGVNTYNGSTLIGSTQTINLNITIPASVAPSVSSVSVSEREQPIQLFGAGYIQGKSRFLVSSSASGAYGSWITGYRFDVGSQSYTNTSSSYEMQEPVRDSDTVTIKVTVTDSRGRTASRSITVSVLPYSVPQITGFDCSRCGDAKGTVAINGGGEFLKVYMTFSVSSLNNNNTGKYKLEYCQKGASSWTALTSGDSYNYSGTFISSAALLNSANSYQVRLTVWDSFTSSVIVREVGTAVRLLSYIVKKTALAIGKFAEVANAFDVALPAIFRKNVSIYGDSGISGGLSVSGDAAVNGTLYANGNINANKDIGLAGSIWTRNQSKIYSTNVDGKQKVVMVLCDSDNDLSIGYGNWTNKDGDTYLRGRDVYLGASSTASYTTYRPYYRRGDSIDVRMGTAGYVTSGTKEFYFTIPLGKPVVGNPNVSVSSINGLIIRQNSNYIIKADWVQPDRYSAAVRDNNAIWVIAFWNNATNAANNSPVGIDANIRITFS